MQSSECNPISISHRVLILLVAHERPIQRSGHKYLQRNEVNRRKTPTQAPVKPVLLYDSACTHVACHHARPGLGQDSAHG